MMTGELYDKYKNQFQKLKLLGISALLLLTVSALLALYRLVIPSSVGFLLAISVGSYAFYIMLNAIRESRKSIHEITGMTRSQGEVIASFSHRIREPLNNLVIACELLSDTDTDEKQEDLIETLIASTNNMVSIVNELTMQSAGTMSFEKRKLIKFNLLSAIHNTVELFNLRGTEGIDFSIESKDINGPEVNGDPIIIKQIILDIINNTPEGLKGQQGRLDIFIGELYAEGEGVMVPISLKMKGRMANEETITDQPPLWVRLITANNGDYNFDTSGDETMIMVNMPFGRVEPVLHQGDVASPKIVKLIKEEPKKKKDLKELNLLLVEDNIINQKITFLTLKPLVNSIETASNGKEALDKIATADYDIILMDIQMPVMDGLIAAEKIRALEKSTNKHVPIIAITANAMLGDKERCLSAGMDDYISKPFHPASLIEKIRKFF